jgi:hypothetical protein
MVAFLQKLPRMNEQDYARLVMESITQGSHRHPDAGDLRTSVWPHSYLKSYRCIVA